MKTSSLGCKLTSHLAEEEMKCLTFGVGVENRTRKFKHVLKLTEPQSLALKKKILVIAE